MSSYQKFGMEFEIIRANPEPGKVRVAVFDFDGTVSLLRADWQDIMTDMMVEVVPPKNGESREHVRARAREMIHSTNGRPTLSQMELIAAEVREAGGTAREAEAYKQIFLERLLNNADPRRRALERGDDSPEKWQMPGVRDLLEQLRARGVTCYLASGTDEKPVREECAALGLADFFAGIYGATADVEHSSKRAIFERLVKQDGLGLNEWVVFGDGVEEIRVGKGLGALAIGIAYDAGQNGAIAPEQKARLADAGAGAVAADFQPQGAILNYLFG